MYGKKSFSHISMKDRPKALSVCTGPYPEFPTDLQSPFMAFLACAKGESRIREQVFEDRFGTAAAFEEKMGKPISPVKEKMPGSGEYIP